MPSVPKLRVQLQALDEKIATIVSRRGFCEQEIEELRLRVVREETMRKRVAQSAALFADILDVSGVARRLPIEEAKVAMEARTKVRRAGLMPPCARRRGFLCGEERVIVVGAGAS